MAAKDSKLHVVMFPWLAFGHIIPYLELAKLIAQKGHQVSFVSTPRNINRLPNLPPRLTPLINFVNLPLPRVNNLPENAEATIDVPYDVVQYLKKAYDGLQEPMTKFLETSRPDWILCDFAPYWLPPIAKKLDVLCAFFSIFTAALLSLVGPPSVLDGEDDRSTPEQFTVSPEWIPFPTSVVFRYFEIARTFDQITIDDSGISAFQRLGKCVKGCDLVAIRGCPEIESEWLQVMEEIYQKPVIPVGQLPSQAQTHDDDNEVWRSMKEWLDKQHKGSVIYIAFGSETKPNQQEITPLALGLELSGLPFFWVFRTRRGSFDTEVIELPQGFEDRTKGRGLICTSWAPQLKILAHDSVGGLLTHSGWSSVVEALQFERPLILLPFLADQGINTRFLEEKKLGYSIPRNERDGSFTPNSVAESLRLVMVDEEGKIYRDNAKKMSGLFGDRDRQECYVDNLLDYLGTHIFVKKPSDANRVSKDSQVFL